MERHFDNAHMSRAKALAERERIDGSFEDMCRVHAELVAATADRSWQEIAQYIPSYMSRARAHRKMREAVRMARMA